VDFSIMKNPTASVGSFEPTIAAGERPQTYALDREANGIGVYLLLHNSYKNKFVPQHIFVM
jgi:hypothetical protein